MSRTSRPTLPADLMPSMQSAGASPHERLAFLDEHRQGARGAQRHAKDRPYLVARAKREIEVLHDCRQHKRRLLQCKCGSDAFPRPDPERKIGEAIDRGALFSEETAGIEHVRSFPKRAVPVQDIRRYHDQRALTDALAAHLILAQRDATDRGDRRIKTDGLFN